ncbi:MAG: ABC transporter ATP-binding protein [Frankia sp.]
MAEIVLDELFKSYDDDRVVLDALSLTVREGEFVVLVGPSGCGKTTALRIVAGLTEPTSGRVCIGEREVTRVPPMDRDVAMVFQSYALYPHMTVFDNMAFALKLAHVPRREIDAVVRQTAGVLGLDEVLRRKPRTLSGGQRQRVAMGRAIVRRPAAFLMDEPLSNLDAQLRVDVRAEIARIQRDLGTTTLYVTHDQVEAMTMADRIAVLHGGRLEQVATPSEVFDHPASVFVAGFIGSPAMNLVRTPLVASGAGYRVTIAGRDVALPDALVSRVPAVAERAGSDLVLGFRPHDLSTGPAPDGVLAVEATADLVEQLGTELLVHLPPEGEHRPVVRGRFAAGDGASPSRHPELLASLDPRTAIRRGDQVRLWAPAERLHVFDAETGKTLDARPVAAAA